METDAETLIEEIDDILVKNNVVGNPGVAYDIAIYVLKREKKALQNL